MHTTTTSDGTTFHHNSDLSGDVEIDVTVDDDDCVRINGRALLELVAKYVRSQRIDALEDATTEEVLGLPSRPAGPPSDQHASTGLPRAGLTVDELRTAMGFGVPTGDSPGPAVFVNLKQDAVTPVQPEGRNLAGHVVHPRPPFDGSILLPGDYIDPTSGGEVHEVQPTGGNLVTYVGSNAPVIERHVRRADGGFHPVYVEFDHERPDGVYDEPGDDPTASPPPRVHRPNHGRASQD